MAWSHLDYLSVDNRFILSNSLEGNADGKATSSFSLKRNDDGHGRLFTLSLSL